MLCFERLEVLSGDGFIHHAGVAAAFSEITQASRCWPLDKTRRRRALTGQRVQVRELLIDGFRERKRIEGSAELLERFDFGSIKRPGSEQAVQRGLGAVIAAMDFGADVYFCFELSRGLEKILEPE